MAFKFSLQTEPFVEKWRYSTLLDDMMELSEIKCEIEALVGQLPELDAVYDNLTSSIEALNNAKNKGSAVQVLNADGSLEALLGIAEDAITVKAATEGLGEKLKYWWDKFITWVKRVCRNIANFFRKLFGFSPKVSKEAQELADLTGANPEDVQKGLDKAQDVMKSIAHDMESICDDKEFTEAFNKGMQLGQQAFTQMAAMDDKFKSQSLTQKDIDDMEKLSNTFVEEWKGLQSDTNSMLNAVSEFRKKHPERAKELADMLDEL